MPTNKHQIIRYQALDKCFRNIGKRYFIEDLIDACQQAISNKKRSIVTLSQQLLFLLIL